MLEISKKYGQSMKSQDEYQKPVEHETEQKLFLGSKFIVMAMRQPTRVRYPKQWRHVLPLASFQWTWFNANSIL